MESKKRPREDQEDQDVTLLPPTKKFKESPLPISLGFFRNRLDFAGVPEKANEFSIGIEDIFPSEGVESCLVENFLFEVGWFFGCCPQVKSYPNLIVVHGGDQDELQVQLVCASPSPLLLTNCVQSMQKAFAAQMPAQKPPLVFAPRVGFHGTHHTKVLVVLESFLPLSLTLSVVLLCVACFQQTDDGDSLSRIRESVCMPLFVLLFSLSNNMF